MRHQFLSSFVYVCNPVRVQDEMVDPDKLLGDATAFAYDTQKLSLELPKGMIHILTQKVMI